MNIPCLFAFSEEIRDEWIDNNVDEGGNLREQKLRSILLLLLYRRCRVRFVARIYGGEHRGKICGNYLLEWSGPIRIVIFVLRSAGCPVIAWQESSNMLIVKIDGRCVGFGFGAFTVREILFRKIESLAMETPLVDQDNHRAVAGNTVTSILRQRCQ